MNLILQKLSLPRLIIAQTLFTALAMGGGAAVAVSMSATATEVMIALAIALLFSLGMAWVVGRHIAARATHFAKALSALAGGDLTHRCDIPGKDEFSWFSYEYSCARKAVSNMVQSIRGDVETLMSNAERLSSVSEETKQGLAKQNTETHAVATSMNRMAETVQHVADHAGQAAAAAKEADQQAESGNRLVHETLGAIQQLAAEVDRTSEVIASLKNDTVDIGAVLEAIRGISEQTNLLALNAAIEAARAGEQGRGFAVVADEVRTLASRTQQSTSDIQRMIESLQNRANEAVAAMSLGSERTSRCIDDAEKAKEALSAITTAVNNIHEMNNQIADQAQLQRSTVEEINQNVLNISAIAAQTESGASQTSESSIGTNDLASRLGQAVAQFKLNTEAG
ncbi:methyl-accepting chemotaxis protein [Thiosocius teredinicola]|uniref:methyl-accepting chemotaxis protein n=1 Tax=Thiosocius teredinicola TaxID=1973002 RepID=UPI000991043E